MNLLCCVRNYLNAPSWPGAAFCSGRPAAPTLRWPSPLSVPCCGAPSASGPPTFHNALPLPLLIDPNLPRMLSPSPAGWSAACRVCGSLFPTRPDSLFGGRQRQPLVPACLPSLQSLALLICFLPFLPAFDACGLPADAPRRPSATLLPAGRGAARSTQTLPFRFPSASLAMPINAPYTVSLLAPPLQGHTSIRCRERRCPASRMLSSRPPPTHRSPSVCNGSRCGARNKVHTRARVHTLKAVTWQVGCGLVGSSGTC